MKFQHKKFGALGETLLLIFFICVVYRYAPFSNTSKVQQPKASTLVSTCHKCAVLTTSEIKKGYSVNRSHLNENDNVYDLAGYSNQKIKAVESYTATADHLQIKAMLYLKYYNLQKIPEVPLAFV